MPFKRKAFLSAIVLLLILANGIFPCHVQAQIVIPEWAEQSSTNRDRMAMRALDGNTDGLWEGGGLASTQDMPNSWWEADLGQPTAIDALRMWNRSDCCAQRLSDFYILISSLPFESQRLEDTLEQPGIHSIYVTNTIGRPSAIPIDTTGRYLRIQLAGTDFLTLGEVQFIGHPLPVIAEFTAKPGHLILGDETTLMWSVSEATQATLTGADLDPLDVTDLNRLVVSPTTTTRYWLTVDNGIDEVTASVLVAIDTVPQDAIVSEVLASNLSSLRDEDRDRSDWIEITNPNPFPLGLQGWGLSDDPDETFKWILPDVQVPGDGQLIVFASGKDRNDPNNELHTNFRLLADGESVTLTRPDGQLASALTFPPQRSDISYGYDRAGSPVFFDPPSPGNTNAETGFAGVIRTEPTFNMPRGIYDTAFTLMISHEEPGADIFFTLDGSRPSSTHGIRYAGSFDIGGTRVVRAVAVKPGFVDSPVATHSYIFPDQVATSSVMNRSVVGDPDRGPQIRDALLALPSISLALPDPLDRFEQEVSLEYLDPQTGLTFQQNAGLHHFGGYFVPLTKASMRLTFRGRYGAAKLEQPLFTGFDRGGISATTVFNHLDLHSGSQDVRPGAGFYLSNSFVDDAMLEMGNLNPHGRFVHLYLDGTYWGQYHLRERFDADFLQSYLGGDKDDYESMNGNQGNYSRWYAPHPTEGRGETWNQVVALSDDYQQVKEILDVQSFVDYMLLWFYSGPEYEYRAAGSRGPGTGYKFQFNDADNFLSLDWLNTNWVGTGGPENILANLLAENHPDFRMLLTDRIYQHYFNDGALTPAGNTRRLNRRAAEMELSFLAESARWGTLSPAAWASARNSALTILFPQRSDIVVNQLRSAGLYPDFDPPDILPNDRNVSTGTQVTLSSNAGQIYYTLDGSDPWSSGGIVSANASTWDGQAIVLEQDTVVRARVLLGNEWSAQTVADFVVTPEATP